MQTSKFTPNEPTLLFTLTKFYLPPGVYMNPIKKPWSKGTKTCISLVFQVMKYFYGYMPKTLKMQGFFVQQQTC